MSRTSPGFGTRIFRFLSQLLKSIWLFFPGILFLFFSIFLFWMLGQGKDIIVAFTENREGMVGHINYTRIVFFLAIGFWVYVSWYSSRVIASMKRTKQEDSIRQISGVSISKANIDYDKHKEYFEISSDFLDEIPRVIGNACFFILELAVLQSPILIHQLSFTWASIILVAGLLLLRFINNLWIKKIAQRPGFRKTFNILLLLLVVSILAVSWFPQISILALFFILLLFHIVFISYINLRRVMIERDTMKVKIATEKQAKSSRNITEKVMDYFCIPRVEKGYYTYFLIIGAVAITCYITAIISINFARNIGPFPFLILAFGVLLSYGNIITAFSIKFKVNFHFLMFLLAFVLGFGETHYVRPIPLTNQSNAYVNRPTLKEYLTQWLKDRKVDLDSSNNGYNVYFVMANGGASRSGYWTSAVLGRIEDSTIKINPANRFSDHVFCLSGTSGGGVGVATFFSLLKYRKRDSLPFYDASARDYLKRDYFTYTFARMLGPDYFNYIFHLAFLKDRAAALEESFEQSSMDTNKALYRVPFNEGFSNFTAFNKNHEVQLPILFVNTTRMQDGNPGVVSNLNITKDSFVFNKRVDVLNLLKSGDDISITSAAIMGARFPYLSPAGRIGNDYFVDGGYFDNSGAGVVQEIIRGIMDIANDDTTKDSSIKRQIQKLHFKVLHIINSPVTLDSTNITSVPPIKNDLMAPILTIMGAYDMQTTVNDGRLKNYLYDLNKYYQKQRADYTPISLYKDAAEFDRDPLHKRFSEDPPYAMNWFMSDTTLRRINNRLDSVPEVSVVLKGFNQ